MNLSIQEMMQVLASLPEAESGYTPPTSKGFGDRVGELIQKGIITPNEGYRGLTTQWEPAQPAFVSTISPPSKMDLMDLIRGQEWWRTPGVAGSELPRMASVFNPPSVGSVPPPNAGGIGYEGVPVTRALTPHVFEPELMRGETGLATILRSMGNPPPPLDTSMPSSGGVFNMPPPERLALPPGPPIRTNIQTAGGIPGGNLKPSLLLMLANDLAGPLAAGLGAGSGPNENQKGTSFSEAWNQTAPKGLLGTLIADLMGGLAPGQGGNSLPPNRQLEDAIHKAMGGVTPDMLASFKRARQRGGVVPVGAEVTPEQVQALKEQRQAAAPSFPIPAPPPTQGAPLTESKPLTATTASGTQSEVMGYMTSHKDPEKIWLVTADHGLVEANKKEWKAKLDGAQGLMTQPRKSEGEAGKLDLSNPDHLEQAFSKAKVLAHAMGGNKPEMVKGYLALAAGRLKERGVDPAVVDEWLLTGKGPALVASQDQKKIDAAEVSFDRSMTRSRINDSIQGLEKQRDLALAKVMKPKVPFPKDQVVPAAEASKLSGSLVIIYNGKAYAMDKQPLFGIGATAPSYLDLDAIQKQIDANYTKLKDVGSKKPATHRYDPASGKIETVQ